MKESSFLKYEKSGLVPELDGPDKEKENFKQACEKLVLAVEALGGAIVEAENIVKFPPAKSSLAAMKLERDFAKMQECYGEIVKAEELLDKISGRFSWDANHEYFFSPVLEKIQYLNKQLAKKGLKVEDFSTGKFQAAQLKAYSRAIGKAISLYEKDLEDSVQKIFTTVKKPEYENKMQILEKQRRYKLRALKRIQKNKLAKKIKERNDLDRIFASHNDSELSPDDSYTIADPRNERTLFGGDLDN